MAVKTYTEELIKNATELETKKPDNLPKAERVILFVTVGYATLHLRLIKYCSCGTCEPSPAR